MKIEYVRECFKLREPEGDLIWRARPLSHFINRKSMTLTNLRMHGKHALVSRTQDGRAHGKINGKTFYKARVILSMRLGRMLNEFECTVFRNKNITDFSITNLHVCSRAKVLAKQRCRVDKFKSKINLNFPLIRPRL